jgi:hypothetical protein
MIDIIFPAVNPVEFCSVEGYFGKVAADMKNIDHEKRGIPA